MTRCLVDTAVLVYADGTEHSYRQPCRDLLGRVAEGALELEAPVDLVQEYAHVRLRSGRERPVVIARAREIAALLLLHPLPPSQVPATLELIERHERLSPRDAVFAATALENGIEVIVSPDRDFDGIDGLRRIDPADREAIARLSHDPP